MIAQFWVPIFSIPFLYLVLDIIVYYVIYVLFLLIFNSIRAASICMVVVTAIFGIFNYELTLFRSMSFIASDILFPFVTARFGGKYLPGADWMWIRLNFL